ncbi:MAG TPA: septum formation initiator family protein [Devosia sp.]|nr:septum formation initiator family protein [Devosia sp.]
MALFQRRFSMSTRLKRPSFWRQLLFAGALLALQGYLGYSVVSGQFGIESQEQLHVEISELKAKSFALQAQIDSMRHRTSLFTPQTLDPDIVSERARALLSVSQADDRIIMVDVSTGKPIYSSFDESAASQLTGEIPADVDR